MSANFFNLLCPFQLAWLKDPSPVAIGEKSRRIGWTWTHALGVVLGRIEGRSHYYHSSADMTASLEFIDYCREWAEMANAVATISDATEVIDDAEINTKVMTFANGRKIVAGSSNPKFFRSKGGEVGLDEFAFHQRGDELLKAAHATARFWDYPWRIWSTHNGEASVFNQLIGKAREGKFKATVHTVTILDAVEDGIVERIDMRKRKLDHVPKPDAKRRQEWLDELRASCPSEQAWQEEFMCVPGSEAAAFLSYDLIRGCEVPAATVTDDPAELRTNCPLYLGMDIGRKRDLTVFWVLAKVGDVFQTVLVKEMQAVPFAVQEGYFNLLMAAGVRRAKPDASGIGMDFAERAVGRWGSHKVEPVTFTAETKSRLAAPLRRLFEDRLIRVPDSDEVREDLHKVRKTVSSTGHVRFDAASDEHGHADRFWALALAYAAADDRAGGRSFGSEERVVLR